MERSRLVATQHKAYCISLFISHNIVAEDGVTARAKLTYWFNNTAEGEHEDQAAALRGL